MAKTVLDGYQEYLFQDEITKSPWYSEYINAYKEVPNLDTPDYDYRGAWLSGERPQINKHDGKYDSGSKWKSKKHKTYWKGQFMDKHGFDPDDKGITKDQAKDYGK